MAQTFTTIYSFDGIIGSNPVAPLTQSTTGSFYGTTTAGSTIGTIYKMALPGTLTLVHAFDDSDGYAPWAGLAEAVNGDFYGTTPVGATYGAGTVFRITPDGALTTLHTFCGQSACPDGADSYGGLVRAANGDFYGTTAYGGTNGSGGTIFKITASGTLTTLYSFCMPGVCTDGSSPFAAVIQATDGNLYGTALFGGLSASTGTVFRITPGGKFTTIHRFCAQSACADGDSPFGGVIQGSDGALYGATQFGGAHGHGTIYRLTTSGVLTTLYSFCADSGCPDGEHPHAPLVQATDGNFYGTTQVGGSSTSVGTVFKITPNGTLTTLHVFCAEGVLPDCPDGAAPLGAMMQATDGNLYGTTMEGGTADDGTIFRVSMGLPPFLKTLPIAGGTGAVIKILGTDLTGTASVTFGGVAAGFRVISASEITTTVPAGAATGTVRVVTPAGTLESNIPFQVLH